MFSFEFCEISKNTFFIEALRATASELNYYFIMSHVTNFHKYYRGEVTREVKIMNHYIKFSISGCISGTEYVFFTFNLTFTLNFSTSSFSLVIFSWEIPNYSPCLSSSKKLVFNLFDHVLHIVFCMIHF